MYPAVHDFVCLHKSYIFSLLQKTLNYGFANFFLERVETKSYGLSPREIYT